MGFFSGVRDVALAALLVLRAVHAEIPEPHLSFGETGRVSQDLKSVPHWQLEGDSTSLPQLLSDRIILTPPWPGNRRGALWTEKKMHTNEWTVEFQFRATGDERGGGNLQVWYTKEKQGTKSVYTAGKFDGLALVVDTYGGRGGSIRGFLNDGTTDYNSHHHVDSLAFGHCDYPYRNLGRLTQLVVKQTSTAFEVTVDDKTCFKSEQIRLPAEYIFGISAASAENPDTFEAFKFIVHTHPEQINNNQHNSPPQQQKQNQQHQHQQVQQQHQQTPQQSSINNDVLSDLKHHLQSISSQLDRLQSQLSEFTSPSGVTQKALSRISPAADRIESLNARMISLETIVKAIHKDLENKGDYTQHLTDLQNVVRESHSDLLVHLPHSMAQIVQSVVPRLGTLVWVMILGQVCLAVVYVGYKRRRANAPKKYL
ncbi:MAG: hypothetical protein M1823_001683 [Watsoniomyces obsoletus]|nr:MAG: hypothetical protein M1823_001683 [Watsoniomyces obsoletus]